MNFDNLMYYDLMTGRYRLNPFLILLFDFNRIETALRNSSQEKN